MAFKPNFEKVVASVRKKIGSVQSQVDCKLPTNDEVSKIICNNSKVNIIGVETSGKDIIYSGFVNFQIIYLNSNNEPISMDYTAEFREKYQSGMELSNVVPIVSASVIDVNTSVNGDIRAVAILDIVIDVIVNNSTNVLIGIDGDNYFIKKENINYSNYLTTASNKFEVINDVEIKDGIAKILSVCPSVYIDKVDPRDRFLTINGGIYFDICYLTDNNVLRTYQTTLDFSQEVAEDDIDENSIIQNDLQILYNDIKITTSINTDSAIVNINLPMLYNGYLFKNLSIDAVSDLYSVAHYTNIVVQSIESAENFENVIFDDKLTGNIVLQDNDAFIDEVLGACCGSVVVANSVLENNRFTVEGVATTNVVYLNKELNLINSVEVEMPFSVSTQVELSSGANTPVKLALTNISTRARRGKEIEVIATLEVYTDVYSNNENAVITQVLEEDEIPESECAMSFYISKEGDNIWEIAKELKVSTEMLLSQNPNLTEPIKAGTKVVVYRQKQVEF